MREILFRGKDPESGTWYEGYYMALSDTTYCFPGDYAAHPDNTKHYIVFDRMTDWGLPNQHLRADVDPVTVGQYTGLKDKNGKKIFEGDIILHTLANEKYKVIWKIGLGFRLERISQIKFDGFCLDEEFCDTYAQVIGNEHDNPELLRC